MKKVAKILAVTGTLVLIVFLGIAVLGVVGYRNLFPTMDKTEAPDSVGKYKLLKSFPMKGNIWGTEVEYGLEYEVESSGKIEAFTYFLYKYWSESGAITKFDSNQCNRKDLEREGILKDKNSTFVGEFKYCGGTLHFRNKTRVVTIHNFTISKWKAANVSDEVIIDFVKNLPYNADLDMSGFRSAYPLAKSDNPTNSSSNEGDVLPPSEIVKTESIAGFADRPFKAEEDGTQLNIKDTESAILVRK